MLVNPVSFRLSVSVFWNSTWNLYRKGNYKYLFYSDLVFFEFFMFFFRKTLGGSFFDYYSSHIRLYRLNDKIIVNLYYHMAKDEYYFDDIDLLYKNINILNTSKKKKRLKRRLNKFKNNYKLKLRSKQRNKLKLILFINKIIKFIEKKIIEFIYFKLFMVGNNLNNNKILFIRNSLKLKWVFLRKKLKNKLKYFFDKKEKIILKNILKKYFFKLGNIYINFFIDRDSLMFRYKYKKIKKNLKKIVQKNKYINNKKKIDNIYNVGFMKRLKEFKIKKKKFLNKFILSNLIKNYSKGLKKYEETDYINEYHYNNNVKCSLKLSDNFNWNFYMEKSNPIKYLEKINNNELKIFKEIKKKILNQKKKKKNKKIKKINNLLKKNDKKFKSKFLKKKNKVNKFLIFKNKNFNKFNKKKKNKIKIKKKNLFKNIKNIFYKSKIYVKFNKLYYNLLNLKKKKRKNVKIIFKIKNKLIQKIKNKKKKKKKKIYIIKELYNKKFLKIKNKKKKIIFNNDFNFLYRINFLKFIYNQKLWLYNLYYYFLSKFLIKESKKYFFKFLKKLELNIFKINSNAIKASVITKYIHSSFKHKYNVYETMRPVLTDLKQRIKSKKIIGFKITISGRFKRAQRATYWWRKDGDLLTGTQTCSLDYNVSLHKTKYGVCTISVWLTPGINGLGKLITEYPAVNPFYFLIKKDKTFKINYFLLKRNTLFMINLLKKGQILSYNFEKNYIKSLIFCLLYKYIYTNIFLKNLFIKKKEKINKNIKRIFLPQYCMYKIFLDDFLKKDYIKIIPFIHIKLLKRLNLRNSYKINFLNKSKFKYLDIFKYKIFLS